MNSTIKPIPELMLEKYLLNELSAEQRQHIENQIVKQPDLLVKLENLKRENARFATRHPLSIKIRSAAKAPAQARRGSSQLMYAFASFLVLLGVSVLLPIDHIHKNEINFPDQEITRIKGIEPSLRVYRKHNDEIEILKSDAIVKNHDILQLAYISGNARYGLIYSVDGNEKITLHYPNNTNDSTKLNNSGEVPLEFSYQLDDAPRFERFYFLTSEQPIDVKTILQTVNKAFSDNQVLESLIANNHISQTQINLWKESK